MRNRKKVQPSFKLCTYELHIKNNVSYNVHNTLVCTISFSSHNKAQGNLSLFQFIVEGESQNLRLINHHFTTISSHFFAISINIFHKTEILTVI